MRRRHATRFDYIVLFMLFGGALFLSGVAGYWRWVSLAGYLVLVAAWWAMARPPLTTRHLNWRWRRRRRY